MDYSLLQIGLISIPGWLYRTPLHHKDNTPFWRSGTMDDPSRNRITLVGFKRYRLIFQVNHKLALQYEKELVFFIVFVPVKFSLHNAETDYTVIHLTKGLIVPLLLAGGSEARDVDQLQETKLCIQVDRVAGLFFHGKSPFSST
jgi:hypothetical protein